jgi:hypothetical protein
MPCDEVRNDFDCVQAAERIEEKKKAQEEADAQRRAQSQPGTASTSTPTNTTGQAGIRCAPQAAAFDKLCQDALSKAQACYCPPPSRPVHICATLVCLIVEAKGCMFQPSGARCII